MFIPLDGVGATAIVSLASLVKFVSAEITAVVEVLSRRESDFVLERKTLEWEEPTEVPLRRANWHFGTQTPER
jgi:hypothetical protein